MVVVLEFGGSVSAATALPFAPASRTVKVGIPRSCWPLTTDHWLVWAFTESRPAAARRGRARSGGHFSAMMGGMGQRVSCPVLVGRDGEVARLRAAIERAVGGQPATVLVVGEAGIGKTRLVTEAARPCRRSRGGRARRRLPGRRGRRPGLRADGGGAAPAGRHAGLRRAGAGAGRRPRRAGAADAASSARGTRRGRAGPLDTVAAVRAAARNAAPYRRAHSGAAGGRGSALGRPVHPRSARLPGPQPPRWRGAAPDLPLRRAAPGSSAAAVPGRAEPRRAGRTAGAGPARRPRACRAGRRDPRRAACAGTGRGDPGPLGGQPVLRRGTAGRPPGGHPAAAGAAGPAAGAGRCPDRGGPACWRRRRLPAPGSITSCWPR